MHRSEVVLYSYRIEFAFPPIPYPPRKCLLRLFTYTIVSIGCYILRFHHAYRSPNKHN